MPTPITHDAGVMKFNSLIFDRDTLGRTFIDAIAAKIAFLRIADRQGSSFLFDIIYNGSHFIIKNSPLSRLNFVMRCQ